MEQPNIDQNTTTKPPRVPIQTYRWEDVRRERLKGGYPWTYLVKEPFDEEINPTPFIMEAMSKSKSSATLRTSSSFKIEELKNGVSNEDIPEHSGYIVITEATPSPSPSHHSKTVPRGSITIEEQTDECEPLNLESAESSDNISQYLDKEEPPEAPLEESQPGTSQTEENGRNVRAKSEEPTRKRKLSIDSSYSRKSLSKLAILKKLKEAKNKIKFPTLSLSSLRRNEPQTSKKEEKVIKEEPKKKKQETVKPVKNEKPVYIHIPLKPPEGETDEFSYLQFGEKKPEEAPHEPKEDEPEVKVEKPQEKSADVEKDDTKEVEREVDNLDPSNKNDLRRLSGNPDEIVAIEIVQTQSIDLDDAAQNGLTEGDFYIIHQDPNGAHKEDVIGIIMPEKPESKSKTPSRQGSTASRKARAKSAEPERKRKLSADSSYSRRSLSKLGWLKKFKEAKDKLKFPKLSPSRSNSKKEKEKPNIKEKEVVEAKDKLKFPKLSPSGSNSKKEKEKPSTKEKEVVQTEAKKEIKKIETPKKNEPKYIHIPLKPPPGETDEFSYLEFEEKKEEPVKMENPKEETPVEVESPVSDQTEAVQFIVLTPPSDEETLEGPDIPDTPSSDTTRRFFAQRVDELTEIAKDAADETSPESRQKKLETVSEENLGYKNKIEDEKDEEKEKINEELNEQEVEVEHKANITEDEEDGLKVASKIEDQTTTEPLTEEQEQEDAQELKSSLKGEGSPLLKKKVSFKRRSRDESSKDAGYEDVQASKDDKVGESKIKMGLLSESRSMSSEGEEKSYLDEKIIKSTSLEEDYNRWSKLSDHEYEPVNPPPEGVSLSLPTFQVTDADQNPVSVASSTTSLERRMLGDIDEPKVEESFTVQEMQTNIENTYFNKPPETTPKTQTETKQQTKAPGKFQLAMRNQAEKIRSKMHGIKKPNIKMPGAPKMKMPSKPKIKEPSKPNIKAPSKPIFNLQKPKFNLPKIPDRTTITFPSFSLPRKTKRTLKERQLSTESNAGDSKSKKYFDFSTYPRFFRKKSKDLDSPKNEHVEFSTVPRTKKRSDAEKWSGREPVRISLHEEEPIENKEELPSHVRYEEDIDIDDDFEKENKEFHKVSPFSHDYTSRWNHGSFHPEVDQQVTDLDSPGDAPAHESFKDTHSSESSLGTHQRGVLEEIDSDEFFLRQKGISQDNIEVGMYLSSEIREAFKSPSNALSDLQRNDYEIRTSNQSLPEAPSKRKPIKKPKRKKTPHVSHEQIEYIDSEQENTELPPPRPKRKSKKMKNVPHPTEESETIPYRETFSVKLDPNESIMGLDQETLEQYRDMYENELMEGKDQPDIRISDPYSDTKYESDEEIRPTAPPRKHRSLKSLNFSEHDSILGDFNEIPSQNVEVYRSEHEYIIPTPEEPLTKPPRTLSLASSRSVDIDEIEPPMKPSRTRSRSQTRSHNESLTSYSEEQPCVEEPCVQDMRDYMGYAIIDKNQKREPPLPPPRTPPRRRKIEEKFSTVPRHGTDEPPIRPLRNYSTLGPSRPPRRKPPTNMTDEDKLSVDLNQYIEIEEESNRDLHSGEVIQKMQNRPLPAPPRPSRNKRKTPDEENEFEEPDETEDDNIVETQLITPTHYTYNEETITHGCLVVEPLNGAEILPQHELTRKTRSIPITKEYDDDEETSEIPESFHELKSPEVVELKPQSPSSEVFRAQKLQVQDLDVDRLRVNELKASKIIVSEIESGSIHANGGLNVGELELPPSVVQQLLEKLQAASQSEEKTEDGQKKNSDE